MMKYRVTSDSTKSIKPKLNLTKILIQYIQKDFKKFSPSSFSNNCLMITTSNLRSKPPSPNFLSSFSYICESNSTKHLDIKEKNFHYSSLKAYILISNNNKGFQYFYMLSYNIDILINHKIE
jgi:hypothetical protein